MLFGFSSQAYCIDHQNSAAINDKVFMDTFGRTAINQVAGELNIQDNSHAIGMNAIVVSEQHNDSRGDAASLVKNKTSIQGLSFKHSQGLVSINQTSGLGNIQSNLGAIGLHQASVTSMTDNELDFVVSPTTPKPSSTIGNDDATTISADSFKKAQGIVQINQISGDENIAINQFSLQMYSEN